MTSVIHHYSVNYSFEDIDLTQSGEKQMPARQHSLPGTTAAAQTPNRITPCLGV